MLLFKAKHVIFMLYCIVLCCRPAYREVFSSISIELVGTNYKEYNNKFLTSWLRGVGDSPVCINPLGRGSVLETTSDEANDNGSSKVLESILRIEIQSS